MNTPEKNYSELMKWESNLAKQHTKSDLTKLARYLLGYRTAPLLKITPGMGGTNSRGIRDFVRFLLGYRGYIRVNVNEQEPS